MKLLRDIGTQMRSLAPSAMAAWAVTLFAGLTGALVSAAARDSSSVGDLATIYVPVMSVPFAFGAAAVLLPLIAFTRTVAGVGRPWLFGMVGVAAAPVQALILLASGRVMFRGSPHMRPTLAADLDAIMSHRGETAVLLGALAAGGLTLGVLAAKRRRGNIADTPANIALEATARESSS